MQPRPRQVIGTARAIAALAGTLLLTVAMPGRAAAQDSAAATAAGARARTVPIFDSAAPLAVTLVVNRDRLRRDTGDEAPWRSATLLYADEKGDSVRVPLRVRTRGNWRLKNCDFPPLRLNFRGDSTHGTAFRRLDGPKLVNHCRDDATHEKYVLQELQLYRIMEALTPYSHHVRLLRTTYADSASRRAWTTRWAFLVEDVDALAERNGTRRIVAEGARPDDMDAYQHVLYAVFQYMIGNTDWSIAGLHNTELLSGNRGALPVAFDFDYAGAVQARYATPDPSLGLRSVRERRYRGYCAADAPYARVFAHFVAQKPAIYALYRDEVGRLMDARTVESTLRYFDEFYATIADPKAARREIEERCVRR